jgi:predicted nucleic acid-binding protein
LKKTDWQYLVDTLLFLCIVGIVVIGFLMGLVIPKGPSAAESAKYFLGLHRHQWGNIHFYLSIAFTSLVIIHLIFSWRWIKAKARQIFKGRWDTALILTAIASLLVLFIFWSFFPKFPAAYEDHGIRAGERAKRQHSSQEGYPTNEEKIFYKEEKVNIVITGKTTLREIEKATGIPPREIAAELGLPSKVSLDETFGRLRKKYPFTLQEVRDLIYYFSNKEKAPPKELKEKKGIQEKQEKKEEEKHKETHGEEHEEKLARGRMAEDTSGILITGRMTLYDIEDKIGIPARKIADKLGLPSSAPLNETLGRLRKRYLFTMQEVRDVVDSLIKKK